MLLLFLSFFVGKFCDDIEAIRQKIRAKVPSKKTMSVEAKKDVGMAELKRALRELDTSFDHFVIAEGFVEKCEEYRTLDTAIERARELAASLESHRGPSPLFKVFTEQRDAFEKHVLPKLGRCERLFLRQVNRESRKAMKFAGVRRLRVRPEDLSSVSQFKFHFTYNKYNHINEIITQTKSLDIIRYAIENFPYKFSKVTATACARVGDFDIFKYIIEKGARPKEETFRTLYRDRHTRDKGKCYAYLKHFCDENRKTPRCGGRSWDYLTSELESFYP